MFLIIVGISTVVLVGLPAGHTSDASAPTSESDSSFAEAMTGESQHNGKIIVGRQFATGTDEAFYTRGTLDGSGYGPAYYSGQSTDIGAWWQDCESTPFTGGRVDCDRRYNYGTFTLTSAAELNAVHVWIGGFNNWGLPSEPYLKMEIYLGDPISSATSNALLATSNQTLVPNSYPTGAERTFTFANPVALFNGTPYTIRLFVPSGIYGDLGSSRAYALFGVTLAQASTCFTLTTNVNPTGGGSISRDIQPNCSAGSVAISQTKSSSSHEPLTRRDATSTGAFQRAQTQQAFQGLIAKAERGPVRVIVGLNVPFLGETPVTDVQVKQKQRQLIARSQDKLLASTRGYVRGSVRRFFFVPAIALDVNVAGLKHLRASPEVSTIEQSLLLRPSLSESVPIIGAPAAWAAGFSGSGLTVAILDTGVDKSQGSFGSLLFIQSVSRW